MVGYPWLPEDIRAVAEKGDLADSGAFLASFEPADYVEPGLPAGLPDLDAALRRAARGTGVALHLDRADGTQGGSDYRDFARAGVPFIRFCDNYSPFYHAPGDTAEALDLRQALRLTRLAAATAWLLADR
jgi:Zn-dependent M28 family amino/carboxypeptidase